MLTNNQLEIMQHALGVQRGRREFRNHFVTGPGSTDYADCEVLVSLGMMTKRNGSQLTGGDPCYHVTDSGRHAIRLARKGEA